MRHPEDLQQSTLVHRHRCSRYAGVGVCSSVLAPQGAAACLTAEGGAEGVDGPVGVAGRVAAVALLRSPPGGVRWPAGTIRCRIEVRLWVEVWGLGER